MNKLIRATKLLFSDPYGLLLRIKLHFLNAKSGWITINGVQFNIDTELDSVMSAMYFQSYERHVTRLLTKYLRKGDTFIDVGANVGYISAFALGLVGKTGSVHAFEPVPQYLTRLRQVQENNPDYSFYVNGDACGENNEVAKIAVTNLPNIGWNTMVPNFMREETIKEEIEVRVVRLSDYCKSRKVQDVRLIKIDTEGFEFPVIKGLKDFLSHLKTLPILIVEVAPSAYSKLNSSCNDLDVLMSGLGYTALNIDCTKPIQLNELERTTDIVFMPKDNTPKNTSKSAS